MTATMRPDQLGLDPSAVVVSRHALDRYMERRGWGPDRREDAEWAIRDLLARCAHQRPPLRFKQGRSGRRFVVGEMVFIVSADWATVITCYHRNVRPQHKRRAERRSR